MFTGDYFITPHAAHQFRQRLAPGMSYTQALTAILRALEQAGPPRPTANGRAHYLRTRGPWRFRAVIRPEFPRPAVVTILYGGKSRGHRTRADRNGA